MSANGPEYSAINSIRFTTSCIPVDRVTSSWKSHGSSTTGGQTNRAEISRAATCPREIGPPIEISREGPWFILAINEYRLWSKEEKKGESHIEGKKGYFSLKSAEPRDIKSWRTTIPRNFRVWLSYIYIYFFQI